VVRSGSSNFEPALAPSHGSLRKLPNQRTSEVIVDKSTTRPSRCCCSTSPRPASTHPAHCPSLSLAMAFIVRPGLAAQATKPMFSNFARAALRRQSPVMQQLRPAFASSPAPASIAAFHATRRQQILPPLPQKIEGTLNEPTVVPNPDYAHGSYHWSFERYVLLSQIHHRWG